MQIGGGTLSGKDVEAAVSPGSQVIEKVLLQGGGLVQGDLLRIGKHGRAVLRNAIAAESQAVTAAVGEGAAVTEGKEQGIADPGQVPNGDPRREGAIFLAFCYPFRLCAGRERESGCTWLCRFPGGLLAAAAGAEAQEEQR